MRARRLRTLARSLERTYGPFAIEPRGDAVDQLVQTILSQATNDRNSERAFARLKAALPTWDEALAAEPARIEEAIRSAGLARQKTRAIRAALETLRAGPRGLSLEGLEALPVGEAMAELEALPGVGPKTAACVLLFGFGRPAMPVDTHVHRLSLRLGLVPPRTSAVETQRVLQALCPPEAVLSLHVGLIRHGRAVCTARAPRCEGCPLRDLCPSAPTAA